MMTYIYDEELKYIRKKISTQVSSKIGRCQNFANISVVQLDQRGGSNSDQNHKLDLLDNRHQILRKGKGGPGYS